MKFICNKKDLKDFLNFESKNYGRRNRKCPLFCLNETDILYKYNYLLRKTEYYHNTNKKIRLVFYNFRLFRYSAKTNIQVPINTCDKGLKFVHLGSRLINGNCTIGKNLVMHINTSIVAKGTGKDRIPTVGDNVIMAVNSVILGDITVGDNVAIAANSVVNKNFVEGNYTLGGIPAKIISNSTRDDWNK